MGTRWYSAKKCALRFGAALALAACTTAAAADSRRIEILPSEHPISKMVVEVAQVDALPMVGGNGVIVGRDGCHVLTNFHVAFGIDKDSNYKVTFVPDVAVGHVLAVKADLNPETRTFNRAMTARVIGYGNYDPGVRRKMKHDLALLQLDTCLGPSYGVLNFELPGTSNNVPQGTLSTLSLKKHSSTVSILKHQRSCTSLTDTNIAGIFYQTCESESGMSGSPILRRESDGEYTLVGLTSGLWVVPGEPDVPFAIYSSVITPFVEDLIRPGTLRRAPRRSPP